MSRRLQCILPVLLTLWGAAPVVAQVGPSKRNVKKPAPKKAADVPVVRVRTVPRKPARRPAPPKPVAAKPPPPPVTAVKPPVAPVPPVTPPALPPRPPVVVTRPNTGDPARLAAAQAAQEARVRRVAEWQRAELSLLSFVSRQGEALVAPALDRIQPPPPLPPRPVATATAPVTYRQKVTLAFVREDGLPFGGEQVRLSGWPAPPSVTANRVELEGARLPADAALTLALPAGWGFVKAEDARLALGSYPGEESRVLLPAGPRPTPPPVAAAPPLFAAAADREQARRALPAPSAPPAAAPGPYPSPATGLRRAFQWLGEARGLLDGLPAGGAAAERRRGWEEAERAVLLVNAAGGALQEARTALDALEALAEPRQVLRSDFHWDGEIVRRMTALATVRALQYRAEAEWWKAGFEQPAAADRAPAIRVLRDAPAEFARRPEVAAQLARYQEVAKAEETRREELRAGALVPEPPRPVVVTRHLTRTVAVQRTEFELRVAEAGLLPTDEVFVQGGRKVDFRLEGGLWRALVPRAVLKPGDRLRFRRNTETSELEGETVVANLELYAPAGTLLTPPPFRLVGIRSFAVTLPGAEVPLFEELTPAQLRTLRADGEETAEKDGSRWLALRSAPVRVRLRPIGAVQVDEARTRKEKPTLAGRVMVDAVVLEGPTAGHVAGLRPGSSARAVEAALVGQVPGSGMVPYVGGALEVVLQDGIVRQIRILRNLRAAE